LVFGSISLKILVFIQTKRIDLGQVAGQQPTAAPKIDMGQAWFVVLSEMELADADQPK
jgi:hypothetical protein